MGFLQGTPCGVSVEGGASRSASFALLRFAGRFGCFVCPCLSGALGLSAELVNINGLRTNLGCLESRQKALPRILDLQTGPKRLLAIGEIAAGDDPGALGSRAGAHLLDSCAHSAVLIAATAAGGIGPARIPFALSANT